MSKIILVRHGETMWNTEGRTQGRKDSSLTEKGLKQAFYLGQRLKRENIDVMYTSPLKRAKSTAEIIGNIINIEPILEAGLAELGFGAWEGLTVKEIQEGYPDTLKAWHTAPHTAIIPEGEGLETGQARVSTSINEIIKESEGKNILLVSHGSIIKLYLLYFLNMDLADYYRLRLDNCSINIIEFKTRGPVLIKYNDVSFMDIILEGEEYGQG
ncbi:histidine phosphatase family protein [Alkaliphilus serpentinus]|uniref:Histidine phosphatase family protein n=1 Tax=Alkaliphilus serpentinus TaxID=1482731 RepID=A0A833MCG2_9FIRM|nr:histidine phosphatase family protein [Alkaliphilus serpentinus]KAB3524952.1 histidine phosphatase family protein [Alkaliphilus serpentinus]